MFFSTTHFSCSPISRWKCTYHYSHASTRNEKIHVFRLIHFMSKCSHPPHIPRESPLHFIWKCTYHYPQTCTLKSHFPAKTDDFNGHHRPRKIDWKFRVDIPQWSQQFYSHSVRIPLLYFQLLLLIVTNFFAFWSLHCFFTSFFLSIWGIHGFTQKHYFIY